MNSDYSVNITGYYTKKCSDCGFTFEGRGWRTHKAYHEGLYRLYLMYGIKVQRAAIEIDDFYNECEERFLKSSGELKLQAFEDMILTNWIEAISGTNFNTKLTFEIYMSMYMKANYKLLVKEYTNHIEFFNMVVAKYGLRDGLATGLYMPYYYTFNAEATKLLKRKAY